MNERILIAGGSGAVGKHLVPYLMQRGFDVSLLGRRKTNIDGVKSFCWDVEGGNIDINCFEDVSHVIQLSGANISEKRWSLERKREIVNSRVNSTNLLFQSVKDNGIKLKTFISASAVGYYGAVTNKHIYREDDLPGNDFLADTCIKWEAAADQFASLGVRTVKIRTGIVLDNSHGALAKIKVPVKYGLGAAFGSGNQYFSWIHVEDLCGIYCKSVCDQAFSGPYNAVSPADTTNRQLIDTICRLLNKPKFFINVPSIFLKIAFGELSQTLLKGSRVSAEKILKSGYDFQFIYLDDALKNLLL